MFLKKINVSNFKSLKQFELNFPPSNLINELSDDKNMQLSVVIGENGTSKTTILQSIIEAFSSKNIDDEQNFQDNIFTENISVIYEIDKIKNKVDNKDPFNEKIAYPSNIVVSSYALLDKLTNFDKENYKIPVKELNIFNSSSKVSRDVIREKSNEVLKMIANNKSNNIKSILKYIGFENKEILFEFSRHALNPSQLRRLFREIFDKIESQENPEKYYQSILYSNKQLSEFQIVKEYNNSLYLFNESLGTNIIHIPFEERIQKIFDQSHEYQVSIFDENKRELIRRILYEFTYIIEKFRLLFFQANKVSSSSFKENLSNRLISMQLFKKYPGKNKSLLKDLHFMEFFSFSLMSDIWFQNDNDNDPVPLSMLSSGELSMFLRLFDLQKYTKNESIVLIDEPETHLHPKWIKGYIKALSSLFGHLKCHIIIATHSPLIISDVSRNSIIGLKKENNRVFQVEINYKTLGLNYEDILTDIFNLDEDNAMVYTYKKIVEKHLKENNLDAALKVYSQLADSEIKFNLHREIQKFKSNDL